MDDEGLYYRQGWECGYLAPNPYPIPSERGHRVETTVSDDFMHEAQVVRAFDPVYKRAAIVPVTKAALLDAAALPDISRMLYRQLDRLLYPWKYPDRYRFPRFVFWPWLDRLEAWWWRQWRKVNRRFGA